MTTPSRPQVGRQSSRVPGGFDTDEDLSPIKTEFDHEDFDGFDPDTPSKPPQSTHIQSILSEDSSINAVGDEARRNITDEGNTVDEKEIRQKLMDMDSSFFPTTSPIAQTQSSGADDTYVFGEGKAVPKRHSSQANINETPSGAGAQASPETPPEMYQTPAPGREDLPRKHQEDEMDDPGHYNTSSLETMSSSPTAAAAARTISRAVSSASTGGYATADDTHDSGVPLEYDAEAPPTDEEATPRKATEGSVSTSRGSSPTPTKPAAEEESASIEKYDTEGSKVRPHGTRKRPTYLQSRMASQRSSYSSYTTVSTEGGSEATVGADYALQSGGSVPIGGSLNSRPSLVSRSVTLGSMASAITEPSDGEDNSKPANDALDGLDTLDEEDEPNIRNVMKENRKTDDGPQTPQGNHHTLHTPTETVIAQHVRDVQVPATMAREFQDRFRPDSPEKRNGAPTPLASRHGKSMTLKEQSNTIDKYMKLNWDLQLKITFLNQALNQRSDEGVKAMISENVELNTMRVNLAKEIRELKRSIRALERDLERKNDDLVKMTKEARQAEARAGPSAQECQDMENEISYLRERVSTYEVNFEKLRHDSIRQDSEKRRMAEILKSVSRRGGSDIGIREELDYFRDELEAETARREEADEENRRLREEIWRLQADSRSTTEQRLSRNGRPGSSSISQSGRSDRGFDLNGTASAASSTLVEQLRHENAKLQRDMRAQESMLTSRNKEKEHLYQEIEELKLASRRGDGTRSVTGESIFERSVSRAHRRVASRASEALPSATQMSDSEREGYETRNGELRDEISALKLEIQDMTRQLEMCLDELGQFDRLKGEHEKLQQAYDNELGVATEDLQSLQAERDEALQIQEQLDAELEEQKIEFEHAMAALHDRIFELEETLDSKADANARMENEMANQTEQIEALRTEVRKHSERNVANNGELKTRGRRIEELEIELEAINNETEAIHKDRSQLRDQQERLAVQYESSQSQIAFLREEQDGDKIKIGDLENSLSIVQTKFDSEKDRTKELEKRLAEERHQHEVIGSKEKQEVQKMIDDLNRKVTSAKEESRQLKATVQSVEIELTAWKELESHMRETLGDSNATRSTFLTSVTRLQKDLESKSIELDNTRDTLAESEALLRDRMTILENNGLEFKRLSDVLERERNGRKQDKIQYENWQKSHQHTSRTVSQKDTRISELESAKQSDRRKLQALESQLKDQLHERNNLLLTLWSRLSATCGPDWQHQNSLINGRVATLEVVSSMLAPFSKALLLAVQHIEGIMVTFKTRVKTIDRDLQNQYRALEEALDDRTKKLEKLENTVQSNRIQGTFTAAPEIAKLRGENRLLKSEIAVLQNKELHARSTAHRSASSRDLAPMGSNNNNTSAPPPSLARHHSSSAVEQAIQHRVSPGRTSSLVPLPIPERSATAATDSSHSRWTHRLRELERRLKAEREARLLDRTGARKRLEEGMKENEELRAELERERERRRSGR